MRVSPASLLSFANRGVSPNLIRQNIIACNNDSYSSSKGQLTNTFLSKLEAAKTTLSADVGHYRKNLSRECGHHGHEYKVLCLGFALFSGLRELLLSGYRKYHASYQRRLYAQPTSHPLAQRVDFFLPYEPPISSYSSQSHDSCYHHILQRLIQHALYNTPYTQQK